MTISPNGLALLNDLSYADGNGLPLEKHVDELTGIDTLNDIWSDRVADLRWNPHKHPEDRDPKALGSIIEDNVKPHDKLISPENRNATDGELSTGKDWANVIDSVKRDSELSRLQLVDVERDDGKGSLALTFRDPETKDLCVVFKGTGREEWRTDLEGLYATDTQAQQEAAAYVRYIRAKFPEGRLILTGHSNGANKAMYATVTTGGIVDECYAFDGQGFSDSFCSLYADRIAAYRNRLHAVNAENDPVSALLTCIVPPENIRFVKSDWDGSATSFFRNHSMSSIIDGSGKTVTADEGLYHKLVAAFSEAVSSASSERDQIDMAAFLGELATELIGNNQDFLTALRTALEKHPEGFALISAKLNEWGVTAAFLTSRDPLSMKVGALLSAYGAASGLSNLISGRAEATSEGTSLPFHAGDPLVRDFSEEAQSELALQMSRLSNVWPLRGVDWDRWYGIEALHGALDIRFALNSMRMDLRKVRELNEETRPG